MFWGVYTDKICCRKVESQVKQKKVGRAFSADLGEGQKVKRQTLSIYDVYVEPKWPLFLKVNPPKTRPFPTKTRVIWVPGIYIYMWKYLPYIFSILKIHLTNVLNILGQIYVFTVRGYFLYGICLTTLGTLWKISWDFKGPNSTPMRKSCLIKALLTTIVPLLGPSFKGGWHWGGWGA